MAGFPLAPWHLWGNSETVATVVQALVNPAAPLNPSTQQLAKVNYGRPDTWRFLFGVQVLQAPDAAVGDPVVITIDFDLTVGLGRSALLMPGTVQGVPQPSGFARFVFDYTGIISGRTKWTSVVLAPQTVETSGLGFQPSLDQFVAEDIQCAARVLAIGDELGANIGLPVVVTVHSYFAPNAHVRPEWFEANFRGNENGGR